jgi:ribonuclease P/MRP protein subunit POP3
MQEHDEASSLVPPAPELTSSVDIGLSSITRALQAMSQSSQAHEPTKTGEAKGDSQSPYAMVFVARGDQPSTFNCHFPKIIGAASANLPPKDRIRLVGFSKPSSERLSHCLHVARVSSVAVKRDAPGAGSLWDFVKERVKPIEASWLEGKHNASYIPTKINSMETTIGPKKVRPSLDQK